MSSTEESQEPRVSTASSIPLTELEEAAGDHQHCLVCYSDLHHHGILPCNHNEICGVCHLRLRHLHGNKKCPICKEEHEKIVTDVPGKTFDEYPMWGDDMGSNYVFRKNVGMFFPTDYYATVVEPLFGYQCRQAGCDYDGMVPEANIYEQMQQEAEGQNGDENNNNNKNQKKNKNKKPPTPLRSLQDHLRVKHRLTLCTLCIDHKRDFVALLPRMAPHQLKKHLTKGDGPGSGFEGHPVCEFCRPKRFYDLTHLHIHLQKEHYKCHVCEKQGLQNQFFRNYQSLEKHFDRSHFLCHDVQCLQARFVVFENEIDLQAHERQVHGGTSSGSSKIQLEFRTRRTGYDGSGVESQRQEVPSEEDFNFGLQGEAFVPAALPQSDGPTLHPLHMQRTAEFRAQSAQIREQQQLETRGDAFPSLQAATAGGDGTEAGGQQHLNLGWTAGTTVRRVAGNKKNAGQVTENDFPALPSSGPKNAANAKLRAGAVSSNRQFAAMRATAMQPVATAPASSGWGAKAAAPPPHQCPASSFPTMPVSAPVNRMENLAPDNFPALGAGTKKAPKYAAATNLATRYQSPQQQQPPSWNSAVDFPAPSSASGPSAAFKKPAAVAPPRQAPPSLASQMDFPPPPSASASNNSVKQRVLGSQAKKPTRAAMANMLQAPQTAVLSSANPQDTLRDMQASLGPAKYKQLKKYTRDFAEGGLAPDAFIDHAAALFDRGYGDPDFWKTIPALVSSCPNQSSVNEAIRYMESLRTPVKAAPAPGPPLSAPPANSDNSWGSAPLDLTPESFPTPAVAATRNNNWGAGGSTATSSTAPGRNAPTTRYVVPSGKKKSAWGGSGVVAAVKQAKVTPGSVASAAANEGPQGGTATKFMAKQNKQQQQQQQPKPNQQQNNQGKKKKKKEKDELRSLAFGR